MNLKIENFLLFLTVVADLGRSVVSFDSKCPPLKLVSGRSRYQWRGRSVRFNCMRSFQLVGVKYATCMNGKWDAKVPICVKNGCRVPSTTHVNGQLIESYRGAVVKIVCNPGYSLIGSPSVYCNGIRWNETFPVCRALNLNPALSCRFEEEDLCGWSQDPMHDFDWKRRDDSTSSAFSNSTSDSPRGHYMYLESSVSRTENDTARLFSPVYQPSNRTCFRFSYRVLGQTAGFLKVFVKPENLELWNIVPSFWINTDQGSSWLEGHFLIDPTDQPFQIVIEGSRGRHEAGETAFDDVRLTDPEECALLESASSTSTETTSTVSDDYSYEPTSCKNRCNEERKETAPSYLKCSCHVTCDLESNCCHNYLETCVDSTTTAEESTTQSEVTTSSTSLPSTSPSTPPTPPPNNLPSPNPPPNHFNNESNEIEPEKPLPLVPPPTTPKRTSNEIHRHDEQTTSRTTPKTTTPQSRPKNPVPRNDTNSKAPTNSSKTPERKTPKLLPPKPATNKTENAKPPANGVPLTSNEIPRRNVRPGKAKPEVALKNTSATSSSAATTSSRGVKLTFLEKPSRPDLSNESPFAAAKPKEVSGKEPPQAIKIDKRNETNGGVSLREVVEFGGTALAILVIIVLGFFAYKRRESRKSERDNMVEDSDVRFLTSDEVLDFTLARPADDDL